jgi:hypothetical protein
MLISESARTSVLQALVERATKLEDCQLSVLSVSLCSFRYESDTDIQLITSAITLPENDKNLVPCLMTLNTHPVCPDPII